MQPASIQTNEPWTEPSPSAQPHVARILVVEDEHLVALDIQLGLERLGHLAIVAYDAESALSRIAQMRFELVLMDIKLGGRMDGIEAAQLIRNEHDIPIVYLTAYADSQTLERARVTDPYGYVLKPFQDRELQAVIEMALHRHEADQQRTLHSEMQRFLSDATRQMTTTLDYRSIAADASHLLVPRYADWFMLQLKETDDVIPNFTYICPEVPERATKDKARLVDSVLAESRSKIWAQIPSVQSLREAFGSEHLDALRSIGARSMICVPLVAREQTVGAIAVVCGRSRHRYDASDLLFIEDFADRLALAIDNALLFRASERAINMRDDVLAIVSHDLRSPLGTIMIHAESLAEVPDVRNIGTAIARSAQRMNRLIGDLLDASALNAGKLTLECRQHSVAAIIDEAVEMFRSQAVARGISLIESSPPDAQVYCDRDRVVQVLSNLIGNAIKFTARGSVSVTAANEDKSVRIAVADTGSGIAPDQLPRLFDRFWRAQAHRHGAGLGLFIARGIIAAHGSKLEVDTTYGVGTKFHFCLAETKS